MVYDNLIYSTQGFKMNIDKIKMVKPNNKEVITSINKDFTNIVNGEIKLNTGLASLSVNLVNSNIFTKCFSSMKT